VIKIGKLYCLIGMSSSGKSTIEKELEKKGLKRIISTTTRPIREGEKEGVDYHYAKKEDFLNSRDNRTLLENTTYRGWFYGIDTVYNDFDLSKNDYVAVVNPNGFRQLLGTLGEDNIVSFYIHLDDKERLLRSLHREEHPDCKEICRRFISDIDLFEGIDTEVDYCVENYNIHNALKVICDLIGLAKTKDFVVGDRVRVKKIYNINRVPHMTNFIGKDAEVFSWIIKNGEKKYKVMFYDEETAYFKREELELIK